MVIVVQALLLEEMLSHKVEAGSNSCTWLLNPKTAATIETASAQTSEAQNKNAKASCKSFFDA